MALVGMLLYHATKWDIEGFFEAMGPEVAPFGTQTTFVEPGSVRTEFVDSRYVQGEPLDIYEATPSRRPGQ